MEPGGRPGARQGRVSGAGLRRLSLPRLVSRPLRLHGRRLSDRPARIGAAPVRLEALPVGRADLSSLWRGHRGGPARIPASVSVAAPSLPASCLPPLHPRLRMCTRGHPRPNAFREAVDFSEGGGLSEAVSLRGSAGSGAQTLAPLPGAVWRGGSSVPGSRWQVLGSSRPPGSC